MKLTIGHHAMTAIVLLGFTMAVFSCGGGQRQRDINAIMKVYDKDPKAFRRKLNTRLPDD